jgi:hypothetical protein
MSDAGVLTVEMEFDIKREQLVANKALVRNMP